jgi:outer membrane cobalamin receptor
MINWLLTYKPIERLSLQAGYRFTGSRYDNAYDYSLGPYGALNQVEIANYHLFDFNAQWKLTNHLLTTLKVENITDRAFQEIQGFQTRGRSVYLGIVATW